MEEKDQQTASTSKLTDIEQRIIKLANQNEKGISDKEIQKELPELTPIERASNINKLLSKGYFDLFHQGGVLLYKVKDPTKSVNVADNEEKVVYGIIEKAGNKGIWTRDIRFKSNLNVTQLKKILKNLVTKKLIKAVQSVKASKRTMYMLYNLEPDQSMTGGAWYTGQEFESEFVDVLNQQCYLYLQRKLEKAKEYKGGPIARRNMAFAKSSDVSTYIKELGISKESLSVSDVETILETLVYDGKVERSKLIDGSDVYRACESLLPPPGIVQVPCGVCPALNRCSDIGSVTPKKCVYIKEWLE